MNAKVSVIMAVYNAEKYLRESMESLLAQTLREREIICVDDGSTDSSPAILEEYRSSAGITVLTQKNTGPGGARNAGLRAAGGEYVIFLDSDDRFEPDMLEKLYNAAEEKNADVVICKTQMFDSASGEALPSEWMLNTTGLPGADFSPREIRDRLFQFTYGQICDKLIRRELLKRNDLCFPPLRAAEDTAFVYKSLLCAERIAVLPEILAHYRVNIRGSVSKSFKKYPLAPYEAFGLVYDFLRERGLLDTYKRSFVTWAKTYLVWQICNAPDTDTSRIQFEVFRTKYNPIIKELLKGEPADFTPLDVKYEFAQRAPFGVLMLANRAVKLMNK